ncbi:SHOCT domain-containing protein [Candidatus Woesearchaeota archaeon]|nr:MAG: SHOCT domain-containing protein [Candidatus Woesearchaeota archaeon]
MMRVGLMGYGWIFQLVILILLFLIIWWLVKSSGSFGYKTDETAAGILKKRLAKGEITLKEYNQLKKEIE